MSTPVANIASGMDAMTLSGPDGNKGAVEAAPPSGLPPAQAVPNGADRGHQDMGHNTEAQAPPPTGMPMPMPYGPGVVPAEYAGAAYGVPPAMPLMGIPPQFAPGAAPGARRNKGGKGRKGGKRASFDSEGGGVPGRDQFSTRNLYVSGLPASTRNEDLLQIFGQFGSIVSAKAIVAKDRPTECQGYGFVMFENAPDAAKAVAGLSNKPDIVVQFAKMSPRPRPSGARMEDPTNLYFSNLPLSYDEARLNALLEPFGTVVSCRILRDYYTQASRGVGFARMQSREVCDKILASFNGVKLEEAAEPLLVKFADSPKHRGAPKGSRGHQQQQAKPNMGWSAQYGGGGDYWDGSYSPTPMAHHPNMYMSGQGGLLLPPYGATVAGGTPPYGGMYYSMNPRASPVPGMNLLSSDGSDGTSSPVSMSEGYPMAYMGMPDPRMYHVGGLGSVPGVISVANPPSNLRGKEGESEQQPGVPDQ